MRFTRTGTVLAVAAAVVVGLAPGAASAQEITVPTAPPGAPAEAPVPPDAAPITGMSAAEVSAQADCTPTRQTYVTHPEWGAVPGACTTGPLAGSSDEKILVDGDRGETIYDSAGDLVWFQQIGRAHV